MIITLCGSARFEKIFHAWNAALSLDGHTVLGLSAYPSTFGSKEWYSPEEKEVLDQVHRDKIAISGAVLFLNRFGYMGESTLSELDYAQMIGKREIFFLESWGKGCGISPAHVLQERDECRAHGVPFFASPVATYKLGNCCPCDLFTCGAGLKRQRLLKLVGRGGA